MRSVNWTCDRCKEQLDFGKEQRRRLQVIEGDRCVFEQDLCLSCREKVLDDLGIKKGTPCPRHPEGRPEDAPFMTGCTCNLWSK